MTGTRRPFAGRTRAAGFLLDPAVVGAEETARRIAALWTPGATLRQVGPRLLVHLPAQVEVRAEHALGLPVEGDARTVELREGGEVRPMSVADLHIVGVDQFVDLSSLMVEQLQVAPAPPPPVPEPMSRPARPDPKPFRRMAGVPEADARTRRKIASLRRQTSSSANTGTGTLDRLLGRTPSPARLLGRRNARYVEELSRSFRDRNWDRALRSAIGVGGLAGHGWAFRVPRRGRVTGPRKVAASGGGGLGLADNLQQHLRQLYVEAAAQLEREGQIMLAAFVHADLLNNPLAAIELIERSGDYRGAAELAEGWIQDPSLSVRLWWRAGDRTRASEIARTRGAFADAVSRLEKVDREMAIALRREWIVHLRAAGDHLGAIQAAWPVAELRQSVVPDLGAVLNGGGRAAGVALAHLLEISVEPSFLDSARALLRGEAVAARDAFLAELESHRAADASVDRELATLALLALAADAGSLPARSIAHAVKLLKPRADQLVVADLTRIAAPTQDNRAVLRHDLTDHGTPILDAVAVAENGVLVALGERGVRLLGSNGRVRGEWDVPTYSLVIADHGTRVLLIAPRGDRCLVHQLDLPNGRPKMLPPLPSLPLASYDGARPVLVTRDGVQWVEESNGRWKVAWRELTDGQDVYAVERSATSMAAVFGQDRRTLVWQWELPSLVLRQRGTVELPAAAAVTAWGTLGTLERGSGIAKLSWHALHGQRLSTSDHYIAGEADLLVTGEAYALRVAASHGQTLTLHSRWNAAELAVVTLPQEAHPIVRNACGLITVAHTNGRVMAIDPSLRRTVADLTVSV